MCFFFLFSKYLPVINMLEVKTLMHDVKKPQHVIDLENGNGHSVATEVETEESDEN